MTLEGVRDNRHLLLGEWDWNGLWQVWCIGTESVLVSLPFDDVNLVVGSDVLVGALHDDDVTTSDGPHDSGGLLLDAVLTLEGVVPVVIAGTGSRGIVNAALERKDNY